MRRAWGSFRVRLLVGALLCAFGLLYITHVTSVLVIVGHDAFSGRFSVNGVMLVVSFGLMIAGMLVVRGSVRALDTLRERLADVHRGRERTVTGTYVSEVQPLVDDLNALLQHHEQRVNDALAKAGDLAHGLKTPLAVLNHDADRLDAAGQHELASALRQQVERMQRHVDYHLAHARAAASGATPGARCAVSESTCAIVRTMERLHAARALTFVVNAPHDHVVRVERHDLDEILGNLVDNACKWTRRQVVIASTALDDRIVITVDDDGEGVPEARRAAVLQRGVRLDQSAPGSGFGLAIVRDLVEIYRGTIALERAPMGGARARVELPRA